MPQLICSPQKSLTSEMDSEVGSGITRIFTDSKKMSSGRRSGLNIFPEFLDHRNVIRPRFTMKNILNFFQNFDFLGRFFRKNFQSKVGQNGVQFQISFKILKELVIMIMTNSLRILKEI